MTLELQIERLENKQLDTSFLYVIGRGNKVGEVQELDADGIEMLKASLGKRDLSCLLQDKTSEQLKRLSLIGTESEDVKVSRFHGFLAYDSKNSAWNYYDLSKNGSLVVRFYPQDTQDAASENKIIGEAYFLTGTDGGNLLYQYRVEKDAASKTLLRKIKSYGANTQDPINTIVGLPNPNGSNKAVALTTTRTTTTEIFFVPSLNKFQDTLDIKFDGVYELTEKKDWQVQLIEVARNLPLGHPSR